MAELIGGSGYDDVQATEPSSPSIGDTWLDTSGGDATGKIYADLGNGADWQILPVQDELQSGRTRELLMLLQDKPVPEVQDPMDVQTSLSQDYQQVGDDYQISDKDLVTIDDFEDEDITTKAEDWDGWNGSTGNLSAQTNTVIAGQFSGELVANDNLDSVSTLRNELTEGSISINIQIGSDVGNPDDYVRLGISGGGFIGYLYFYDDSGQVIWDNGSENTVLSSWSAGTLYEITFQPDFGNNQLDIIIDGVNEGTYSFNQNSDGIDEIDVANTTLNSAVERSLFFDSVKETITPPNSARITDRFAAPTTEPTDFKQWNAIQARDVTTGGSTSPEPVEFEILDSADAVLNSTRIPKARIVDEPFTMRNRVYSESATSDGQSDYTIATTGDGGHFGIPILTVVSVKQNGSVLDSANWSFDPDMETVTLDTSNVSIASGDTIEIKYDFDVFDSALQPRAYLNRESNSETSPSISHFRYEYVI